MAAQVGVLHFMNWKKTRGYTKQFYADDTNQHPLLIDAGQGAASGVGDTFFIAPEDVILDDIIFNAATTVSRLQLVVNGVPTSDIYLVAAQLAATTSRNNPNVGIRGGAKIAAIQLT